MAKAKQMTERQRQILAELHELDREAALDNALLEWGTARCSGYCARCRKHFQQGEQVVYRPGERPAYGTVCGCGPKIMAEREGA